MRREKKEPRSIINLYGPPPPVANFFTLATAARYISAGDAELFPACALSVFVFMYPQKAVSDSPLAALLYIIIATGMGLLISTFASAGLPPFSVRQLSR